MLVIRGNQQLLLMVVALLLVMMVFLLQTADISKSVQTIQKTFSTSELNQISDSQLPTIHPYACPRSKVPDLNMDFIICVKRPEEYISKQLLQADNWDMGASLLIMSMVKRYPDATFLDIGSNIGPFSIMVASTRQSVVAVDPFGVNLAYIRLSARLGGFSDHIRVIENTVSSEKMTLFPWTQDPNNEGYITFLSEEEAAKKPADQVGTGVTSVTFEDVLNTIPTDTVVLKIDVEGAECKVLTEYMNRSDKLKFIPYIYMEWSLIRGNNFGLCPHIDQLITGFTKSGYTPHMSGIGGEPASLDKWAEWWDVLWIHKDAASS